MNVIAGETSRLVYLANTRPITYVNCWMMRRSECVAMWTNYLSKAPGAVIRSTFNRVAASFDPAAEDIPIGKVRYIDYLSPEGTNGFRRFNSTKSKFVPYEYEQELRALYCPFTLESPPNFHDHSPGFCVTIDLATLIEGVVAVLGNGDDVLDSLRGVMMVHGVDPDVVKTSVLDHPPRYS